MAGVGAQASARETAELTMKAKAEDKITIYGLDGTYIVEFRTAAGEALAISIPRTEATVIRHFQARMPYGLVVRDIDNR
jgi:hypothetical protein